MILDHFCPGMALGALVFTSGTTSTDTVRGFLHQSMQKLLPKPGFASFNSLVSGCLHLMAKTQYFSSQFTGNNQNSFLLSPPLLYLLTEDLVTIQMQHTPVDVIVFNSWAGQKQFTLIWSQFSL